MAFSIVPNLEVFSGGHLWWLMKESLVAAGWSVPSSGDASTFSASGDVHAPGGPYAGSLDNTNAWFRLRAPATMTVRREFVFQRVSTNDGAWRVWYSSDGIGFTGGSPSATVLPTAADQQGIVNTPSSVTLWWPNNTPLRADLFIGDEAEEHSFLLAFRGWGGAIYRGGIGIDVLTEVHPDDADPAMVIRCFGSSWTNVISEFFRAGCAAFRNNETVSTNSSNHEPFGWFRKGLTGAAFVPFALNTNGVRVGFTTVEDIGDSRYVGQDSLGRTPRLPAFYSRGDDGYNTCLGWKGRSRIFKYEILSPVGLRLTASRDRLVAGAMSLPWDGSSDLII